MAEPEKQSDAVSLLQRLHRRVQRLTVAVVVLILAVLLNTAAIYGDLVNYFGRDRLLQGGVAIGAVMLGFLFGWFARGRK
jgi:hypothetical protein